ncbi:phosphomevalonate kinase [Boletus reticuloceps]|uniref:Phosphomevalonate kinase n=1 Tax=Boletus reticuloceps TaxID=495285 RepID=A0A8I2YX44_9AGAM|nr:phosphomevalonate kinase [Boletus reticuloceps]
MSTTTVVSAPGKVLIAGGYLVLDQKYTGLVISASSRFYAVIQDCQQPGQAGQIIVRSPQFIGAEWTYSVTIHDDGTVDVSQTSESKNKFVYYALKYTLILASERLLSVGSARSLRDSLQHGLDIAAVGDNDFYSQQAKLRELSLPSTVASLASITPFCPQDVRLDNVNKTGMGSSAALITSVVSALLLRFKVITREEFYRPDSDARKLAHNTAQFVHCFAQGKVGSGFDVSAAVFGSQLYMRFNPVLLDGLMKGGDTASRMLPLSPALSPGSHWDYRTVPIHLPPLVRLLLADVSAGSDTPSLASKVLKWRQETADEADALWAAIDTSNQTLATQLRHLFDLHERQSDLYVSAVKRMSLAPSSEVRGSALFILAELTTGGYLCPSGLANTRALMRQMGKAAGDDVHIEPDTQTELLDASIAQKGVICGGVPGAGGYDAIWLLVFEPNNGTSEPLSAVEKLWEQFPNVSPLLATESKDGGAKVEDIDKVPGLRAVVQMRR